MKTKFDKSVLKKNSQELAEYLQFQRRGTVIQAKKGKGSYTRKQKYRSKDI